MNKENDQKLFDRFSFFHPELPMTENLMCFGFECGDGWFDLIWQLCLDIEKAKPTDDFIVVQVKEKFGGLRFYVDSATDEVFNIINKAEEQSYKVCEFCGTKEDVKIIKGGWLKSLCPTCEAKRISDQRERYQIKR